MRNLSLFVAGLCLVCTESACSREKTPQPFRVMFYNVENLFDTEDDPDTHDEEFLPDGLRRWTLSRYYTHLRQTARVISAAGEWDTPALVGLCEVENDSVVTHLLNRTPLRAQHYRYCMTRGNDSRGINNVLLYQPDKFRYLGHECGRIGFGRRGKRSRDILHVWGKIITGDTLDVFVCHFPSRSGGEKETEQDRMDAARHVRRMCDSLYRLRQTPNLLLMGDFNDTPANRSIRTLTASAHPEQTLLNLFADEAVLKAKGSHKYQGEWSQLDQMMISKAWKRFLEEGSPRVFNAPFLLTEDKTKRGQRPKRLYYGIGYEGGFSDHLPVVADFLLPLPE
ncbi:MAG: endonuclease [Tannerella sp.]|jgi:predicted extracellular nuclease|nr:endonuclease [Tannerella sp.]